MLRKETAVPRAVVERLTKYLAYLNELEGQAEWVSSADIALHLELNSATVRRDLVSLEFSGVANRGYDLRGLLKRLTAFLGADATWKVAVAGAGNLGKAMVLHGEWSRRGFLMEAIFDNDRRKIEGRVGTLRVEPIEAMPHAIASRKLDIGVIAVPAPAAQGIADLMIAGGIRGLFNLALTHIVAPAGIPVTDVRLAASMIELGHRIKCVDRPSDVRRSERRASVC